MEMKMIGKTFFSGRGKGAKQSRGLDDLPLLLNLSSWGNPGDEATGFLAPFVTYNFRGEHESEAFCSLRQEFQRRRFDGRRMYWT